ncbi:hypothetical protein F5882DRAFT_442365 [Hyaloscypha sp. PMI_1271]|nr:hypothetical protein F5882DRAFT_442365 [Hyaloscypha sp. PMI_1271]
MPGGSRRPHCKTRSGCLGCKARRIKCDEVKPSCGTCTRYSSPCTFPARLSTPQNSTSSRSPSLIPHSPQPSFTNPASNTPFNTQHLELLHLYTTTTVYTFTTLPARAQIYQHIVPQLAFRHPFLLSGILALSALHLSHLHPARKDQLHRDAVEYHDVALKGFKQELGSITKENCEALYVFSTFLVVCAWAGSEGKGNLFFSEREGEGAEGEEGGTAEWVNLLRGSRTLARDCYAWVMDGPVRTFIQLYNDQPKFFDLPEEDTARFAALETLWGPESAFTRAEKEALSEALRHLKEIYAMLLHYGATSQKLCTIAMTIAWSTITPDTYISLVSQRCPEALVLLAHYCLLLSKIDNVWWLNGISRHLLRSVCRMIGKVGNARDGGEGKWEAWISWPLQELVLTEFRGEGEEEKYGLMREENRLRVGS